MHAMAQTEFVGWLLAELQAREWSQADLSRAAKVSNAAISDVLSGRRNVGRELATKIARGLKLPTEMVFQKAGFLPAVQDHSEEIRQIIHEAEAMSREEQLELLSYIRWRNNRRRQS